MFERQSDQQRQTSRSIPPAHPASVNLIPLPVRLIGICETCALKAGWTACASRMISSPCTTCLPARSFVATCITLWQGREQDHQGDPLVQSSTTEPEIHAHIHRHNRDSGDQFRQRRWEIGGNAIEAQLFNMVQPKRHGSAVFQTCKPRSSARNIRPPHNSRQPWAPFRPAAFKLHDLVLTLVPACGRSL